MNNRNSQTLSGSVDALNTTPRNEAVKIQTKKIKLYFATLNALARNALPPLNTSS
jgi:hypothetical protein